LWIRILTLIFENASRNSHERQNALYTITTKDWEKDPFGTSFYFKPIDANGEIWSVRAGDHYRAFGVRDGEEITWFWIGTHEEANRLIKKVGKKNTDNIQGKA